MKDVNDYQEYVTDFSELNGFRMFPIPNLRLCSFYLFEQAIALKVASGLVAASSL